MAYLSRLNRRRGLLCCIIEDVLSLLRGQRNCFNPPWQALFMKNLLRTDWCPNAEVCADLENCKGQNWSWLQADGSICRQGSVQYYLQLPHHYLRICDLVPAMFSLSSTIAGDASGRLTRKKRWGITSSDAERRFPRGRLGTHQAQYSEIGAAIHLFWKVNFLLCITLVASPDVLSVDRPPRSRLVIFIPWVL